MAIDAVDYDFFGIAAVYKVSGGLDADVTIVIDEDADKISEGGDTGSLKHEAEIYVRQSEVNLRPVYLSTFVLDDGNGVSQTWTIVREGVRENRAVGDFTSEWVCQCDREERPVPV